MKHVIGAAAAAGAVLGSLGAAHADEPTFSGNVALASDYTFRGISQTGGNAALQGGFDYANGIIYAGVWGSNVEFGFGEDQLELDLYGGVKPTVGPITFDIGVIGYFYPGAGDDGAELDYYEGKLGASFAATEQLTLGALGFYSPEFTGETGNAYYLEANGAFTLSPAFALSGAYGFQSIDDVNGPATGTTEDDYSTWNIGATWTIGETYAPASGFVFDVRYVDTSVETSDPIVESAFTADSRTEGRVVATLKKAL